MAGGELLVHDHRTSAPVRVGVPGSVTATSEGLGWEGLSLEHQQLRAGETPEGYMTWHWLSVGLTTPRTVEDREDGRWRRHTLAPDEVVFRPAGVVCRVAWRAPIETINVAIDPAAVTSAVPGLTVQTRSVLGPDPVAAVLLRALRAEAVTGGPGRAPVTDGLRTALAAHLVMRYGTTSARGAAIRALTTAEVARVREYVEAGLSADLRLADLVRTELAQVREALDQEASGPYEVALTTLGTYLGATAAKPPGKARCDSAWRWDAALWLAIEAKSEEQPAGLLPPKDMRQANTQLDQMVVDDGVDHAPPGSATILISDRLTVDPEHAGTANPNVYLVSTEVVSQIAGDVEVVWNDLLAAAAKQEPAHVLRRQVQDVLTDNGCLPTQAVDRLTQHRIRPGD